MTVLDGSGVGQDGDIISGVVWAADHGADVILMPFSSPDFSPTLQDAIDYAWSHGAVLVAAAGNDGSSAPHFPSGDRGVVGVANTDESEALNTTSNSGPAAFMAAPGTAIRTTGGNGGYTTITGTSASAAAVAGAAALLKGIRMTSAPWSTAQTTPLMMSPSWPTPEPSRTVTGMTFTPE